MAAATYSVLTATDVVELHRKVQGKMLLSYNNTCEELKWHSRLSKFELAASLREVTTPVDIRRNGGGASLVAGGYEAKPLTVAPEELTFTFIHQNFRYSFDRLSELLGRQGDASQVFDHLQYQARKNREAMCERFSMMTYGFSSGVVCLTSTNATQSSGTYTLIDAYGKSDLDTAAYLSQFFKTGDRVALRRSGALVTNAIGTVTSVGSGTIDVTWNGSVDSDANDEVLLANQLENTTLAGGTDHNKWHIGFLDIVETASIHGLSSSSAPLWAAGSDTTGGRFSFVKLRKGQNFIKNNSSGTPDTLVLAQGVEADTTDGLLGTNRYGSTMGMELDGSTKVKGLKVVTGTRWTPNSRAFMFDSSKLKRWEPVGQIPDESGNLPDSSNSLVITDKLQDLSAKVTGTDHISARVITDRASFYMWSGLQEQ